ncbi:MAG: recombination protein O N-terminal domain-containing protein, partial [Alistipes sp.]|nr:recombination protein O N-terminal domain-containing protein [Alistipes sp.]
MKRYTARGVVLNTVKYGDRGLIVQMLTSSHGRQSYMVQG